MFWYELVQIIVTCHFLQTPEVGLGSGFPHGMENRENREYKNGNWEKSSQNQEKSGNVFYMAPIQ